MNRPLLGHHQKKFNLSKEWAHVIEENVKSNESTTLPSITLPNTYIGIERFG